jgi:glycosyltransferase involved in cell wall biosynthesis
MTFAPISVLQLELSRVPDGPIDARNGRALCLVRIHGQPLGFLLLELDGSPIAGADLLTIAWRQFGLQAEAHLARDGLMAQNGDAGEAAVARLADVLKRSPWSCRARSRELPAVTVVVPTRDRPERLAACLEGLSALDYRDFDIVVVDNAPTSTRTEELVRATSARLPRLHYEREWRPGQAWARNRGLAVVSTPIVAFVDDDVLVDPLWLSAIAEAFDAAPDVGCVTGMIVPAELETEAQQLLEDYGGFSKGLERRVFGTHRADRPDDPLFPYTAGTFGSGASMAFRTNLLRGFGGFDLALGSGTPTTGGEELSAFLRVLKSGHSIVYEPAAIVWHFHPREYRQLRRQIRRYGVGLGAYLTACVADDPRTLGDFLVKLGRAITYFFASGSPKNRRRRPGYPRTLVLSEAMGVLLGPFAYLRGRRLAHALAKGAAPAFPPTLAESRLPSTEPEL